MHSVVYATVRQCMDESWCYLCTVSFVLQYDSVWISPGVIYAQCRLCYCTTVYGLVLVLSMHSVVCATVRQCMDESCYLCTVSFVLLYDSVWISPGVIYAQCRLCYCTTVYG